MIRDRLLVCFALLAAPASAAPSAPLTPAPPTPAAVLAASEPADWRRADPADLLVMDLPGGRRVTILLAPDFAPAHAANIRALAQAGWFDGTAIERVQDDYVTQWGDPDGRKPLPRGVDRRPPEEYDRAAAGLAFAPLGYADSFAPRVGLSGPFPVAAAGARAWMAHCYGIVGVGRELAPDTGSGGELYAVIGHSPRALDRNIALVGRVVAGMEHLAALPRGTADMGFYADPAQRTPILRARLAANLPEADRPAFEWLKPETARFQAWVQARANRHDTFFTRPAGAIDLCNALPPVRAVPAG